MNSQPQSSIITINDDNNKDRPMLISNKNQPSSSSSSSSSEQIRAQRNPTITITDEKDQPTTKNFSINTINHHRRFRSLSSLNCNKNHHHHQNLLIPKIVSTKNLKSSTSTEFSRISTSTTQTLISNTTPITSSLFINNSSSSSSSSSSTTATKTSSYPFPSSSANRSSSKCSSSSSSNSKSTFISDNTLNSNFRSSSSSTTSSSSILTLPQQHQQNKEQQILKSLKVGEEEEEEEDDDKTKYNIIRSSLSSLSSKSLLSTEVLKPILTSRSTGNLRLIYRESERIDDEERSKERNEIQIQKSPRASCFLSSGEDLFEGYDSERPELLRIESSSPVLVSRPIGLGSAEDLLRRALDEDRLVREMIESFAYEDLNGYGGYEEEELEESAENNYREEGEGEEGGLEGLDLDGEEGDDESLKGGDDDSLKGCSNIEGSSSPLPSPSSSNSSPDLIGGTKIGTEDFDRPKIEVGMDPVLAELESKSRLNVKAECCICGKRGINFPKCPKRKLEFCSRECRIFLFERDKI